MSTKSTAEARERSLNIITRPQLRGALVSRLATYPKKAEHRVSDWGFRHLGAIERSIGGIVRSEKQEGAIVNALWAWLTYADAHAKMFDAKIGDDYVLGVAWIAWGKAIRALLNGETGGLDCGTLDAILVDTLKDTGNVADEDL